jgi:hypothetical protein
VELQDYPLTASVMHNRPPKSRRRWLRFSLRTLLVFTLLLCVLFATLPRYFRSPPNEVSMKTLERRAAQVKPGMTVAEISDIFGFEPDSLPRELGIEMDPYWTFVDTDEKDPCMLRSRISYHGTFINGKLIKGGLYRPLVR